MSNTDRPTPKKIFSEVRISSRYSRNFPDHMVFAMQMKYFVNSMVRGFMGTCTAGLDILLEVIRLTRHKIIPPIRCRPFLLTKWDLAAKFIKFVLEKVFRIKIPEKGKDITDVLSISSEVAKQGGEVRYRYHKAGESKILLVKIPAGIKSGQKIRLREMGVPGKAGGPAGDLLLMVKIKIPFFQRIKSIFKV